MSEGDTVFPGLKNSQLPTYLALLCHRGGPDTCLAVTAIWPITHISLTPSHLPSYPRSGQGYWPVITTVTVTAISCNQRRTYVDIIAMRMRGHLLGGPLESNASVLSCTQHLRDSATGDPTGPTDPAADDDPALSPPPPPPLLPPASSPPSPLCTPPRPFLQVLRRPGREQLPGRAGDAAAICRRNLRLNRVRPNLVRI